MDYVDLRILLYFFESCLVWIFSCCPCLMFYVVILDPKGGDAGIVSPGVGKSLRTVQGERDDLTTSTRLAIDPTTARKSRKRLGKN